MSTALALVPTPAAPDSLQQRFEDSKLTLGDIARATGLNKSTISYAISGTRPAKGAKGLRILGQIEEVIDRQLAAMSGTATSRTEGATDFETRGQKELIALLEDTYRYRELSVLCGVSGAGKTESIQRWRAARPDVLYVKVPERNTYVAIVEATMHALGLPPALGHHNSAQGFRKIVNRLKESNIRMIVVDEADLMLRSQRIALHHKIGFFRELWDEGKGPAVAFVGLPHFLTGLGQIVETYLWSRIAHAVEVTRPTRDDLRAYWLWRCARSATSLNSGKLDSGKYVEEAVRLAEGRGNFRLLNKIADRTENIGLPDALALFARRGMGA